MGDHRHYETMNEKVQDAERYLITRVDEIRRWVTIGVGLCAVCAVAAITSVIVSATRSGPVVMAAAEEPTRTRPADTSPAVPDDQASSAPKKAEPRKAAATSSEQKKAGSTTKKSSTTANATGKSAPASTKESTTTKSQPAKSTATQTTSAKTAPAKTTATKTPPPTTTASATTRTASAATKQKSDSKATTRPASAKPDVTESPSVGNVSRKSGASSSRAAATGSSWEFRIGESALASDIVSLEPVGIGESFPGTTPRVFYWTRVETDNLRDIPEDKRYITHRWIRAGEVVKERSITIGSTRYRIYSMMPNPGAWGESWRVEAIDGLGRVIERKTFTITP